MLKRLVKKDVNLIINFFHKINQFNEEKIRLLYDTLDDTKIICANIDENNVTSLLITNIIKNNYYLEEVLFSTLDFEEIKELINFTVRELRKDERGLNIIYDNFPYSEIMHKTMIENGFKCNFINMLYQNESDKVDLINPAIAINDKSVDVKEYIYLNYVDEIKSNNVYSGKDDLIPNINLINLENTNVAVMRDKENNVIGTIRFGIVGDYLNLYSLYANDEKTYVDLLTLVKNLTRRNIEISCYPSRISLIEILEKMGFKKYQTDYNLKIN